MAAAFESADERENFEIPEVVQQSLLFIPLGLETDCLVTAVQRVIKLIEIGLPTSGLAMALQIWYRTLSGNTFTEAIPKAASRCHISRNKALQGIKILLELNIVNRIKRHGQTDEYQFTDVDQWQQYVPPIPDKDTRTSSVIEFPVQQVETESIPGSDIPVEDTNIVVVNKYIEETTTQEVSAQQKDASNCTRWKYVGVGLPRVYVPGELDQDTGMMIEALHEKTKVPVPLIIKDGITAEFERVFGVEIDKPKDTLQAVASIIPITAPTAIPQEVLTKLKDSGIYLTLVVAERLWQKYQDKFVTAIAYVERYAKDGLIKRSKEGLFVDCLEKNWQISQPPKFTEDAIDTRRILKLSPKQREWLNRATIVGFCYPQVQENMGQLAVSIPVLVRSPFDAPTALVSIEKARAMQMVLEVLSPNCWQTDQALRRILDNEFSTEQITEALENLDRQLKRVKCRRNNNGGEWEWISVLECV